MRVPRFSLIILMAAVPATALLSIHFFGKPRVLTVDEVPVAFWAWRTQAPGTAEVQRVFAATNAKTLFLRAGQFDLVDGKVQRIRPVSGEFPSLVELHLVYNGTRNFLRDFEHANAAGIAEVVIETYRYDLAKPRANDKVRISGLQLDLDIPTRLLPKYAEMLRLVRGLLPPDTALSITGLPTWAASSDIYAVLEAVDFWIPQCYGASIPMRFTERRPISSPDEVKATVSRIRKLEKPFYAGLSAYSYAILYGEDGDLIELRGDIDPAQAAGNTDLELIDTDALSQVKPEQIRYDYRAKNDTVLDGLTIRAGETLVFDLPTAETLRASARAVRENAGESLLGICVFRLPTAEDAATLSIGEIVSALTDTEARAATMVKLESVSDRKVRLQAKNIGTAGTIMGNDALTIDLDVPAGSVNGPSSLSRITAYETLCRLPGFAVPRPCSAKRANLIRLRTSSWEPDAAAAVTLSFSTPVPAKIHATVTMRLNDGRIERESIELHVQNLGE